MAITDSFKEAVAASDVTSLRIMMKNSLLVDPTFVEFEAMNELAQKVSGLLDAHDGREFENNKASWNDDYMNKLMVQVVGNFSEERIAHLKEVVRHLRPTTHRSSAAASGSGSTPAVRQSYREQKQQDERDNRVINDRHVKIATGVVAGGIAGGAVVAVLGGGGFAVFVGVATGAAAIGVVVARAISEGE